MAARSSGLIAGLVVTVVLTTFAFGFMFTTGIMVDERKQAILAREEEAGRFDAKVSDDLEPKLAASKRALDEAKNLFLEKKGVQDDRAGWLQKAKTDSIAEHQRVKPASNDLADTIRNTFSQFRGVIKAMKDNQDNFDADERRLLEDIRIKNSELMREVRRHEGREKEINKEIDVITARLEELRLRLKMVQIEAMRGKTISDACGYIVKIGAPKTNFVVVSLGAADRMRRGLKFRVWALRRGYGLGWVRATGRDFIKENILAGDTLVVGRGEDALRHPIVSVGVSRSAEEKGVGLAGRGGEDTLKVIGPGVTRNFSVAGLEWDIERASDIKPSDEIGVLVKGMIEITEVRKHSSDGVILPAREQHPVCPQCGWLAYAVDMRYCPFCSMEGETSEAQSLDVTVVRQLNRGENIFQPIVAGDRLSNPFFSPNRPLVFLLGSQPARQTRQHMKAFIEHNGGRVVDSSVLLVRPEEPGAAFREVMPYEVNYLIPGVGPEADDLLKRARDLGIRGMRESELYEFFGEID